MFIKKTSNILLVIVIVSAAIFFFSNNGVDPDLWGHLKFGQDIYEKLEIPHFDYYSYSATGAAWINHEWLSELIFFTIFKFSKGAGLIIFKCILGLIIAFLIFNSIKDKTNSFLIKSLFTLVIFSVISNGFLTRPQIFTYLFFTFFVYSMDKFERTSNARWLYAIPAISLIWCNLHGGFVIGIGVLLLYLLFKIYQKKATRELVLVTFFAILVTFINPYGKQLWVFLLKSLSTPRPDIDEWSKAEFSFMYLDYFVMVFLTMIGLLFSKTKRSAFEITVLVIGFFYSFLHNRHVVLFAILFAIYMPKYIDSFAREQVLILEKKISQKFFIFIFSCIATLFLLATMYFGKTSPLEIEIPEQKYPLDAIMFMKDNKIEGNIFSYFDWAEMCMWELSDKNKIFFDGRYKTVYSDDFIKDYFKVIYGKKDYKDYLKHFPETDIILMHKLAPLTRNIMQDKDWILIYLSPKAYLFINNNNKNSRIIERFKNNNLVYERRRPPFYLR